METIGINIPYLLIIILVVIALITLVGIGVRRK